MRCMAKKNSGPKKPNRTDKHSVQFFTNGRLVKALKAYLDSKVDDEPPKKKAFLETAIKEALAKRGFWPPKDEKNPPPATST